MTELTLKTNNPPSYINKDTLFGAAIGALVPLGFIGIPIGAVIGSFLGKSRLEKEAKEGKRVSDNPSFWNKDTLIGGVIGGELGALAGMGVAAAIVGGGMITLLNPAALFAAGAAAIASVLAGWAGGTAIGAYIGGKAGQRSERNEFEIAKTQVMSQDISKSSAHAAEVALSKAIANSKGLGVDHVQELEQQRMKLALQQQEAGR